MIVTTDILFNYLFDEISQYWNDQDNQNSDLAYAFVNYPLLQRLYNRHI